MADYKLEIVENGVRICELTTVQNFKCAWGLNAMTEASFDIPLAFKASEVSNYEANLISEYSELRVYRDTLLIWAGIKPIIEDNITGTVLSTKFTFIQNSYYLSKRYFTGTFTNLQESEIALGLINATQADTKSGAFTTGQVDLGITAGTLATNQVRTRTYANDEIWKALVALSEVINGGDFILAPSVKRNQYNQFHWASEIGTQTDVKFGFEDSSIISVKRKVNPRETVNYVEGTGAAISVASRDTDQDRLNLNKMTQENYKNDDVSLLATLQEYTEGIVEAKKKPLLEYVFTVQNQGQFGTFDIGDWVKFKVDLSDTGGRFVFDEYLKVFKIDLTVDMSNGYEMIKLEVGATQPNRQNNLSGIIKAIQEKTNKI